jgi:hypothetical protein
MPLVAVAITLSPTLSRAAGEGAKIRAVIEILWRTTNYPKSK